ncbi:MAG: alpha/beta hydrolase-fold protein [Acidobacteriota bacterium]
MKQPDLQTLVHDSRLLRGNPMGDPHRRRLPVYLPPGYASDRSEPYPVVYLLAGWGGRGARYLNDEGAFGPSLPERLDRLISAGELQPVIVVFPDCTTRLGASQYVNSAANGPYMDYLCDEIVPFVDDRFHTHKSRDHRGILGHSSGGFGALATGMMRPDRFAYICSSAGDCWYEHLYRKSIPMMVEVLEGAGGVESLIDKFLAHESPLGHCSRAMVESFMNLSICACFAPNLEVPVLKGDIYFDPRTGELVPEVWEKFLSWDPLNMVDRFVENLGRLKWIHLEAGTQDEYGLHLGHRQLARRLDHHGIAFVIEEYPGRHGGHHYRFGERIRKMLNKMGT